MWRKEGVEKRGMEEGGMEEVRERKWGEEEGRI